MKRKNILDEIYNEITPAEFRETEISMFIAEQIHKTLKKKGIKQKELAKMLGKRESEISKLLSGTHNFTIRTIALIETALDEHFINTQNDGDIVYYTTEEEFGSDMDVGEDSDIRYSELRIVKQNYSEVS